MEKKICNEPHPDLEGEKCIFKEGHNGMHKYCNGEFNSIRYYWK